MISIQIIWKILCDIYSDIWERIYLGALHNSVFLQWDAPPVSFLQWSQLDQTAKECRKNRRNDDPLGQAEAQVLGFAKRAPSKLWRGSTSDLPIHPLEMGWSNVSIFTDACVSLWLDAFSLLSLFCDLRRVTNNPTAQCCMVNDQPTFSYDLLKISIGNWITGIEENSLKNDTFGKVSTLKIHRHPFPFHWITCTDSDTTQKTWKFRDRTPISIGRRLWSDCAEHAGSQVGFSRAKYWSN